MTTSSPGSIARVVGRACGFAAFGPDAMMGSKLLPLAPRLRISTSRSSAKSRSVGAGGEGGTDAFPPRPALALPAWGVERKAALGGPGRERGERGPGGIVGKGTRGRDAPPPPGLLAPPQLFDHALRGHELVPV